MSNAKQTIETGKAVLGIEFGSTRIDQKDSNPAFHYFFHAYSPVLKIKVQKRVIRRNCHIIKT